jgi:hypothetical protein
VTAGVHGAAKDSRELVRRKEIESTDRKAEGHPRGNSGGRSPNRGVIEAQEAESRSKAPRRGSL